MRRWLLSALVTATLALLVLATTGSAATPALTVTKVATPLDGGLFYVSTSLRKEVDQVALQNVARAHPGYRLVVVARLPKGTETPETAATAVLAKLKNAKPPVTFVAVAHVTDQGTDLGGAMADGSRQRRGDPRGGRLRREVGPGVGGRHDEGVHRPGGDGQAARRDRLRHRG